MMSATKKKMSISLALLLLAVGGITLFASPVFAWSPCSLALSPSTQSTVVGAGQPITLTYLLTYNDVGYASTFQVSAMVSSGFPSGTWTVVSVSPPNPVPSTASDSISQVITVTVSSPSSPVPSQTTLTVSAVNNYDSNSKCSAQTTISTTAVTTPEFPLGMLGVAALALPFILYLRSKVGADIPHAKA